MVKNPPIENFTSGYSTKAKQIADFCLVIRLCLFFFLFGIAMSSNAQSDESFIKGHYDDVSCVAFSPDQTLFATGGWDNAINVYTHEEDLQTLGATLEEHQGAITSIQFSRDNQKLVSASQDGKVIIWAIQRFGKEISIEKEQTFRFVKGTITKVIYGPYLKFIYAASAGGKVISYDIEKRKKREFRTKKRIESMCISTDRRSLFLAQGTSINEVNVFGKKVREFVGHHDIVTDVLYTLDRRYLISTSKDKTIIVWNLQTGEIERRLKGHEWSVSSIAATPNSQYLASCSIDGRTLVWEIESGEQIDEFMFKDGKCTSVAFAADGSTILTGLILPKDRVEYGSMIYYTGLQVSTKSAPVAIAEPTYGSKRSRARKRKSGSVSWAAAAKKKADEEKPTKEEKEKIEAVEQNKEVLERTDDIIITIEDE